MGTRTGTSVVRRARTKSGDTKAATGIRWPDDECLDYINDATLAILTQYPAANPVTVKVAPAAGTRQNLVDLGLVRGLTPIDVTRNFDAAGTVPGRSITLQPRRIFDDQSPDWHNETGTQVDHWCVDPRDPKTFWIRPGLTGGKKIELVYSAIPDDLTSLTQTIPLDDVYAPAYEYFLLFSFFAKGTDYTQNGPAAAQYYQLFLASVKAKGDAALATAMAAVQNSTASRNGGAQ